MRWGQAVIAPAGATHLRSVTYWGQGGPVNPQHPPSVNLWEEFLNGGTQLYAAVIPPISDTAITEFTVTFPGEGIPVTPGNHYALMISGPPNVTSIWTEDVDPGFPIYYLGGQDYLVGTGWDIGFKASFSPDVSLDTTPPEITCPADMVVPCSVDLLAPATFSVTATDNLDPSPIVICTPESGSSFPVGTTTVQCTATDASGNQSSCSFTITRLALGFSGFLSPINGADATGGSFENPIRTFKMGSTIPIKFTATCGDSDVLTGIHTLQVVKYSSATTVGDPIDATPRDAATTGNQFRLTDGQWHFNVDTRGTGMSVGIWLFVATLSDGSQHTVWLQLK